MIDLLRGMAKQIDGQIANTGASRDLGEDQSSMQLGRAIEVEKPELALGDLESRNESSRRHNASLR
jgi:hypothetical protein